MFGRLGFWEILLIVVLVLILFSHNKIPGMMKNLANGINIFKKELKDTGTAEKKSSALEKKAVSKKSAGKKKTAVKKK